MVKFIPSPAYPDAMPVDLSFVFAHERPAGKHGFLTVDGTHFRFEDGTQMKFWGVCLSGSANFPEHDYAEKLARRLAQAGVNCVRTHWMDSEFNTPNIFCFTKGPRVVTTRKLDPTSLDRFDYLIKCLKEQGIYIYLDNMTFRKFKSGDDVPYANELDNAAKPYTIWDRRLIELQKEYITQLWTHINAYTGVAYKDEPAVILTEVTNENDLYHDLGKSRRRSPHYEARYRELFHQWLVKNGREYDWENCDMYTVGDPTLDDFRYELTTAYYGEIRDHLRSVGVRIPVNGTNWRPLSGHFKAQEMMDFNDAHHYYFDWLWDERQNVCTNAPINGYPSPAFNLPKLRADKPFFVSEWDMPWPNEYRAEGAMYYASLVALQDWDGMGMFCYHQGKRPENIGVLGTEMSSQLLGGYGFEPGEMSCWNDPAKFGLFQHAALIVRRGDISPCKEKVGVLITTQGLIGSPAFQTGTELHRLVVGRTEEQLKNCDRIVKDTDEFVPEDANIIESDTKQVRRYLKERIAVIDTPRTKVVYGMLARNRSLKSTPLSAADGFVVEAHTDFGVVALSSLNDDAIEQSDNLLLTAIGRAVNTDMVSCGDKILDIGHAPILSEVIEADIAIRTDRTDFAVWGVNAEGYYISRIEVTYEDGWMKFRIGERGPASYYLIQAE